MTVTISPLTHADHEAVTRLLDDAVGAGFWSLERADESVSFVARGDGDRSRGPRLPRPRGRGDLSRRECGRRGAGRAGRRWRGHAACPRAGGGGEPSPWRRGDTAAAAGGA